VTDSESGSYIYQCPAGHLLCSDCFNQIGGPRALCPTCARRLGNDFRNRPLEKIRDRMKKTRRTGNGENLQKPRKKKKASLHLPRHESEQNFGAAASRIIVAYADLLLISAQSAAACARRKAVAVVLLAANAFRRFPHADIFSFCRSRFFPVVCTVVVLAAVVAITVVREQALLDLRRTCFPKVFDKQQFQSLPRGMGRKQLLIWSDRNLLELAKWVKTCRMEEQRKRQEFKLFVVGLPQLLFFGFRVGVGSGVGNPYIIQGADVLAGNGGSFSKIRDRLVHIFVHFDPTMTFFARDYLMKLMMMASEHTLAMRKLLEIRKFQRYFNSDELRQTIRLYNGLVPSESVISEKMISECECLSSTKSHASAFPAVLPFPKLIFTTTYMCLVRYSSLLTRHIKTQVTRRKIF
jgi:hypothetical protein